MSIIAMLGSCGHGSGYSLHRSSHLAALSHLLSRSSSSQFSPISPNATKFVKPLLPLRPRPHWPPAAASDWRAPWRGWCTGRTTAAAAEVEVGEEQEQEEMETEVDMAMEMKDGMVKAPHVAVLLKEVMAQFEGRRLRAFVDCTLGAAGHASAILRAHPKLETFIGLDVDPVAHTEAEPRLWAVASTARLHLVRTNFRNIKKAVADVDAKLEDGGVDGILMDLGMSSMQVNMAERGFSFMKDGPADMRMDPSASLTAGEILNKWPEAEVARILCDYGEERRWRQLARKIVEQRLAGGIHTTAELVELIGGSNFGRVGRGKAVHPATRTFQALRIAVNDELRALESALADAFALLAPRGRLAVISFHSLEDRIVKQFFLRAAKVGRAFAGEGASAGDSADYVVAPEYLHIPGETRHSRYSRRKPLAGKGGGESEGTGPDLRDKNVLQGSAGVVLTKRPVMAEADEINTNPRSRSAKLRVIEKL